MSLNKIHKAIYGILASKQDTYVGIRVASMNTPCFIYEITGANLDLSMGGVSATNHWTITVQVQAVADTVDTATSLVDDIATAFTGVKNDATNLCSIVLAEFSVTFSVEPVEDGREDGTRVGTVQLTLLVQED